MERWIICRAEQLPPHTRITKPPLIPPPRHKIPTTTSLTTGPRRRTATTASRGFGSPDETASIARKTKKKPVVEKGSSSSNDNEEDDEIPKEVFDRMLRRILWSIGAPMGTSIGSLYVMEWLQQNGVLEVPKWVPFATVLVGFGSSALGIAYGTLSSSWEEGREGSFFGWEELQRNWPQLWAEEDQKES